MPPSHANYKFSSNALKRLGKRFRDGTYDAVGDVQMLEDFRNSHDPLLVEMSAHVDALLVDCGLRFLLSGRSKRTKSIIRKLRRPQNIGMDLSRMGDLVGLRAILDSVPDQDLALARLATEFPHAACSDLRASPGLYRAVHIIVQRDGHHLEIQLRTIPQHLWAVESESFGERAKEGDPRPEERAYLQSLSDGCAKLDADTLVTESLYSDIPLLAERMPYSGLLGKIRKRFYSALETSCKQTSGTYVVVFDRELGQLLHTFPFASGDRQAAIARHRWATSHLPDTRYDVIIFNSFSPDVLAATHPRFFP